MPPAPNRQEDASEADGWEPSDKSRRHAPIRPLFDTEAERLALTLHQLQCKAQRLTAPHHHRQGGRGTLSRGEWKQRMGTKEGTQGLRDMAEARTGVQGPQQWATVIQEQEGCMVCVSWGHLKDRFNQVRCHKEGGPSVECQDKEGSGVCGQHHHKLLRAPAKNPKRAKATERSHWSGQATLCIKTHLKVSTNGIRTNGP